MRVTNKYVFFFSEKDVCSNFYPCKINYDGIEFNCSEQLFMYFKALYFKDFDTAKQITKTSKPYEAKKLGRLIKNYDDNRWNSIRDRFMLETLRYKYLSCEEFKSFIKENENKVFVEASPYDKIWGVGLSENDTKINNSNNWKGENRLGKCINSLIVNIPFYEKVQSNYR